MKRRIAHYDAMDAAAAITEDEAAAEAEGQTLMVVPTELVPKVRELIAKQSA